MFCTKCQNDLSKCTCSDLEERLAELSGSKSLVFKRCKLCGQHYARCKCKNPEWEATKEEFNHLVEEEEIIDSYEDFKSGVKIINSNPDSGYDPDVMQNKKYLKLGETYTVSKVRSGDWHTEIYLEEFPDIPFNSIQFKVCKDR